MNCAAAKREYPKTTAARSRDARGNPNGSAQSKNGLHTVVGQLYYSFRITNISILRLYGYMPGEIILRGAAEPSRYSIGQRRRETPNRCMPDACTAQTDSHSLFVITFSIFRKHQILWCSISPQIKSISIRSYFQSYYLPLPDMYWLKTKSET